MKFVFFNDECNGVYHFAKQIFPYIAPPTSPYLQNYKLSFLKIKVYPLLEQSVGFCKGVLSVGKTDQKEVLSPISASRFMNSLKHARLDRFRSEAA